jgi:hypothetical protein
MGDLRVDAARLNVDEPAGRRPTAPPPTVPVRRSRTVSTPTAPLRRWPRSSGSARTLTAAQNKVANLEIALQSSQRIGAAVGILMARFRIGDGAAFALVRTASQRQHRKLCDIAETVLYTVGLEREQAEPAATGSAQGASERRSERRDRQHNRNPGRSPEPGTAELPTGAQSDLGHCGAKGSAGQPAPAEPVNCWRAPSRGCRHAGPTRLRSARRADRRWLPGASGIRRAAPSGQRPGRCDGHR